ncbi:MAG: hypothetical protein ACOYVJ_07280 [Nitrospirota bacterium]
MKHGKAEGTARRMFLIIVAACILCEYPVTAAEQAGEGKKVPLTKYWMSVSTINQTIPGMSEAMAGMGKMFGGTGGAGFGPRRELILQLNSPWKLPVDPLETHDIPPGQKMGKTLPLMIPEAEKVTRHPEEGMPSEHKFEKPKFRMLIYWGCGETVRTGQPKIIDTEKMSPEDFGKAFSAVSPSPQYPPSPRSGWIYADWPNRKSTVQVPQDSSLRGEHVIHGNYAPEIRFSIGEKHDFMAPVNFTSVQGGLDDSIRFQWQGIPTAIGYFALATGYNQKDGEMIFWSSSNIPETAFSLMNFLKPGDVQKFISEKIVMPPSTTTCSIPRGIFRNTGGGMLQFIAYGDEMNVVFPPKPKDPDEPWDPIWTAKVRVKSTGMLFLGQMEGMRSPHHMDRGTEQYRDTLPEQSEPERGQEEDDPATIRKLRGILGF